MLNTSGQSGLFGVMLFLFIFVMAITVFAPTIKEFTTDARTPANLDCENDTLTVGERSTCIVTDLTLPYFFTFVVLLGGTFLVLK